MTFLLLLLVMRLMGKRQIGEMQPFELVITLVISDLSCLPLTDSSIPLLYGGIAIISLLAFHQVVAIIVKKSVNMRKIVCGRPSVVITPSGIDFKELRSLDMTTSDLLEAVRNAGYFSLEDIQYAIFETNGNLSVLEKANARSQPETTLPLTLIEHGKIIKNTLTMLKLEKNWVQKKFPAFKQIQIATIDEKGKMFIQKKNGKPESVKVKL